MIFKIGDRVRRRLGTGSNKSFNEGDTGIIVNFQDDVYVDIKMDKNKEISTGCDISNLELISSNYKPKTPTHIVIWEEDRDPARFFTSENDAKKFIKELSDNSNVKKDSILLVEVKSCKKVRINKVLRYSAHKI